MIKQTTILAIIELVRATPGVKVFGIDVQAQPNCATVGFSIDGVARVGRIVIGLDLKQNRAGWTQSQYERKATLTGRGGILFDAGNEGLAKHCAEPDTMAAMLVRVGEYSE